MIDTSLYSFFVAQLDDIQIQQGKVDFARALPFLWFRRSSTEQARALSGATFNNFTSFFDVEIVSDDIDEVQTICDTIKTALQDVPCGSVVGTTFCQAINVNDHSDDYLSKSLLDTDDGLHLATFQIQIFHSA